MDHGPGGSGWLRGKQRAAGADDVEEKTGRGRPQAWIVPEALAVLAPDSGEDDDSEDDPLSHAGRAKQARTEQGK